MNEQPVDLQALRRAIRNESIKKAADYLRTEALALERDLFLSAPDWRKHCPGIWREVAAEIEQLAKNVRMW